MGMLLKAVSDSEAMYHPLFRSLVVKNVAEKHAEELHLQVQSTCDIGLSLPRIRLPDLPGSVEHPRRKVHWVGPCMLDAAIRT